MKKISPTVIFFVFLIGCTDSKKETPVTEITPRETVGLLANDFALVIDIREEAQIKKDGMIAQAQNISAAKIEANDPNWQKIVERLPKNRQIIICCENDAPAKNIASTLSKLGHRAAYLGRFEEWKKAGLPVKTQ